METSHDAVCLMHDPLPSCEMQPQPEWLKAREAALTLLGVRARSRRELADRLRGKGFDDEAVGWACAEMERLRLLDDLAFAEAWVRDRLLLRPRGARALAAELQRRGVDGDTARLAIRNTMQAEQVGEAELCRAAAAKWLRTHRAADADDGDAEQRRRLRRRLAAYLQRRGFGADAIRDALP